MVFLLTPGRVVRQMGNGNLGYKRDVCKGHSPVKHSENLKDVVKQGHVNVNRRTPSDLEGR